LKLKDLKERRWKVIKSCFVGEIDKQFGFDEVITWLMDVLSNDVTSKQRIEWRQSHKTPND
jgi:hypothetical protein